MDLNDVIVGISNSRELIALNSDLTNFQSEIRVISEKNAPFRAIVVNQTVLDSLPENGALEMKDVAKGIFSVTITKNSGVKDMWYLALEADTAINVSVTVHTEEIEPEGESETNIVPAKPEKTKKGIPLWLILLIMAGVFLLGYFAYKHFFAAPVSVPVPASRLTAVPETIAPTINVPVADDEPVTLDFSDLPEL